MPSPILARADALMQRRRQNIGENDDVPILTDTVDDAIDTQPAEPTIEDDDIPVLLDEAPAFEPVIPAASVLAASHVEPYFGATPAPEPMRPAMVLTPPAEARAAAAPVPPAAPAISDDGPALEAGIRDILAHELARRVEQRLVAELPRLIESALRDFLAEQEMIAALQPKDR